MKMHGVEMHDLGSKGEYPMKTSDGKAPKKQYPQLNLDDYDGDEMENYPVGKEHYMVAKVRHTGANERVGADGKKRNSHSFEVLEAGFHPPHKMNLKEATQRAKDAAKNDKSEY